MVLNRDTARENGLVVLEPASRQYAAILKDDEFAVIQFQSLDSFDGYTTGFGIVAISKPTEEKWVILQATPHDDLEGIYYTFPSTSVIVEACKLGISQVNKHLRKFWSFDDLMQTESFQSVSMEAEASDKAMSVRENAPVETGRMLQMRESYRRQKSAESLLSAIARTQSISKEKNSKSEERPISWLFKDASIASKNAGFRTSLSS